MRNLIIAFLFEVVGSAVWAWPFAEETVESHLWTFEVSNGEATVHGVEPAEGALVIPKTLGECPVTAISGYAFCQKPLIASVSIPAGVKTIGAVAFQGCTGLLSVSLPDSLTTIGDAAFYGCAALKTIRIPSGVTEIGSQAFEDCRSLTEIAWPKGCTIVPNSVFEGCTGLTSFAIPYGVESVGGYAFAGCSSLKALAIPRSVVALGDYSLYSCSSLERICVAKDDTDRVYELLENCDNGWWSADFGFYESKSTTEGDLSATEWVIPGTHKWKDEKTGLTWEYRDYHSTFSYYEYPADGISIYAVSPKPKGVLTIPSYINGHPVRSVDQPPDDFWDVHTGREEFLNECAALTKIIFPDTLIVIGSDVVRWCPKLTSVYLPEGLLDIDKYAFTDCAIGVVEYPSTLKRDISDLLKTVTTVSIRGGNNEYFRVEGGSVYYYGGETLGLEWGAEVLWAVCKDNAITTLDVRESCKAMRAGAASRCPALRAVTFPVGFCEFNGNAFRHCPKLTSVRFLGSKVTIGPDDGGLYGDSPNVTTYVPRNKGWDEIVATGTWQGRPIKYLDEYVPETSYGPYVQGMSMELDTGLWGYSAKGLPSGLSYDAKTGKISGRPKKQTDAGGVEVTLTKKGAADVLFFVEVRAEEISIGCEGLSVGKLPAGVLCSSDGMGLQVDAESDVKSVSVTKLPTGMKYDSKKMLITGAPTKAGDFEVVLTVTTAAGNKKTVKMPVSVLAMPEAAVGKFDGFVSVDDGNCGTFTLTTTDAGKLTAKVVTAAGTYSFSAASWDSVAEGAYSATLQTKKGDVLTLSFDSTAAWDENQLTGSFTSAAVAATKRTAAVPARTYSVLAQRNAFGKIWYFSAEGDETTGWTLAYAAMAKTAALTVTLKADGTISIAGALPGTANKTGKPTSFKVSASGYANVGAMRDGAILADFAPVLTVNKVKKVLAIHANLWFDRQNGHDEGVGGASFQ